MKEFFLKEREKLSPFKISPFCQHFGKCGGCTMQDIAYEKQLQLKRDYLLEIFKKNGILEDHLNLDEFIPSSSIYYYRNKMEFCFGTENNQLVIGLRESNLNKKTKIKKVVPLTECPIFSLKVKEIFSITLSSLSKMQLPAYEPYTKRGFFRHLLIRETKNTHQIMLCLVTKSNPPIDLTSFIKDISKIEQIKSIYWIKNDIISDAINFQNKELIWGSPFIEESLSDLKFRIYPETFFQPNTELAEILYLKILKSIKEKNTDILSLYSGAGTTEIFLSKIANEIIGIDSLAMNINTAWENAQINGIKNCRFLCQRVEKIKDEFKFKDFRYLIVDPVRAGISSKAMRKILSLGIPNLIYISCNPLSLLNDLLILKKNGYTIKKISAFDFYPHTFHIETMVCLEKI